MVSYLGSLVQFSPAAGRAGHCRQTSLCVGSTPRVPATLGLPRTGVSVLSPSTRLRLPAALYGAGPVLSAVPVFASSTEAQIRLRLRVASSPASAGQAARGLRALSPGLARLFPPRPQQALPDGFLQLAFVQRSWPLAATLLAADVDHQESQEVFRQEPGPVCRVGGGGFSGAEFAPCPSPRLLPPAGMGRLFSAVSQSLCLRTAGGVFPPVNFSLALPQFKRAPSDCSQGLQAGPYPKQCRPLLSVSPLLAGGGCGRLGYFSAGSCF